MAYVDRLASHAAPHLEAGERLLSAVRANPRGCVAVNAILGGLGAAVGIFIGTSVAEGYAAAVVGAGLGAAAGVSITYAVACLRFRNRAGLRSPNLSLGLTSERLLLFGRSPLTNRPDRLERQIPLDAIGSIEVGPARFVLPHPLRIELTDGTALDLEVAGVDDPEGFAAAFADAAGR